MTLNARARRRLLLALAAVCLVWTIGMPVLAQVLYQSPKQQPRGAAKYVFYCHVL